MSITQCIHNIDTILAFTFEKQLFNIRIIIVNKLTFPFAFLKQSTFIFFRFSD